MGTDSSPAGGGCVPIFWRNQTAIFSESALVSYYVAAIHASPTTMKSVFDEDFEQVKDKDLFVDKAIKKVFGDILEGWRGDQDISDVTDNFKSILELYKKPENRNLSPRILHFIVNVIKKSPPSLDRGQSSVFSMFLAIEELKKTAGVGDVGFGLYYRHTRRPGSTTGLRGIWPIRLPGRPTEGPELRKFTPEDFKTTSGLPTLSGLWTILNLFLRHESKECLPNLT